MNKAEKIKAEIERLKKSLPWGSCASQISMECNCKNEAYNEVLSYIDTLEEEPVSNDLEEAARKIATRHSHITGDTYYANDAWFFKKGAQWQKQQDQSTIELAEDHAYLAGQEKIIAKACDWLADNYSKYIITNGLSTIFSATIDFDTIRMIEDFKKAMEE